MQIVGMQQRQSRDWLSYLTCLQRFFHLKFHVKVNLPSDSIDDPECYHPCLNGRQLKSMLCD